MKSKFCILALFLSVGCITSLRGDSESDKYLETRGSCCKPCKISKATRITHSGPYCVTKNIRGVIEIAAPNVELDLNYHLVNGAGAPAAIVTNGFNNVTIKNGSVTNPGSLAIDATNAIGLQIENVQVYGSDQALALSGCTSSSVTDFKAYNNTNTFVDPVSGTGSAVILVDGCETISLVDVEANNNTKALSTGVGTVDPGVGIITINNSSSVILTNCTCNNNTRTNDVSRFAPIAALFSSSVKLINCQSNYNSISVADNHGFAPIYVRFGFDTVIEDSQANGNQLLSTTSIYRPIYIIDSPRNVLRNCQVNDNIAQLLVDNPGGSNTDFSAIYCYALSSGQSDNLISHCQVCGNTILDGGAGAINHELNGIVIEGAGPNSGLEDRTVIEYCQVSDNVIQTAGSNEEGLGIYVASCLNVLISNCSVDNNSGGQTITGILLEAYVAPVTGPEVALPNYDLRVINCSASENSSLNFTAGIVLYGDFEPISGIRASTQGCQVIGCQANRNIATAGNGLGIALQNVNGCQISQCQMNQNSLSGFVAGASYLPSSDTGQINQDCIVSNCSASENGSNGFEVNNLGSTNNFLFKDNITLANTGFGFYDHSTGTNNRYLGNYASNNAGGNFSVTPVTIQLFTLSGAGTYTNVSGDATHFSSLTNVQAQ